jgi:hypothetical protein
MSEKAYEVKGNVNRQNAREIFKLDSKPTTDASIVFDNEDDPSSEAKHVSFIY